MQCINRWLSVRLELLGISVVFGTAILVAGAAPRNAGLAGLALTSALNLTGLMNWMVRQTTELEVSDQVLWVVGRAHLAWRGKGRSQEGGESRQLGGGGRDEVHLLLPFSIFKIRSPLLLPDPCNKPALLLQLLALLVMPHHSPTPSHPR